jgi:hypothetical protein
MDLDHFLKETVGKSTQQQCFYHFTDRKNLPLIRAHGLIATSGLRSDNLFDSVKTGGDALSLQSDAAKGTDKYVCLCFRSNHPMAHAAMNDERTGVSRNRPGGDQAAERYDHQCAFESKRCSPDRRCFRTRWAGP